MTDLRLNSKLLATLLLTFSLQALVASPVTAQTVETVAGGFVGDGGAATEASFVLPEFVVQDPSGNVYISDLFAHRIRKVTPAGIISTYAGTGISGYSGDGGPATSAMLRGPTGLTIDSAGNLIIADQGNERVRQIDTSGIITTIAGNGVAGYSGDGGPATEASLNGPWGVTLDAAGNLYITDILNQVVREVDTPGIITTFAGNGVAGYSGDGGPATEASLNFPRGMVLDTTGNLYIADTFNHRVRIVNTAGNINTFAGNGNIGFSGDGGLATSARIGNPRGLAFLGGALYISNAGSARIRAVTLTTGIINTFAGSFFGFDGDGHALLSTQFFAPTGLWFDASGNLLVVDSFNGRLRELAGGVATTTAGGFIGDAGPATLASLVGPANIAFDTAGNYYIADTTGNRIRKVNTMGQISTVAGTGVSGYTGDGGPAIFATLFFPEGVAADSTGNIFIADNFNGVIRKVDTTGTITTFAADPNFFDLASLAVDPSGNLYSVDQSACVVRQITPDGTINVVAGMQFSCGFNGDGIPATAALLNLPYGVAMDSEGNIYIGDSSNNRVRKVSPSGIITTIAGDGACGFSGDGGPATSAELCSPLGVGVDSADNIYIADELNLRVRKISKGIINTLAGSGLGGFNGDGLPALSTNLDDPEAVAVSSLGGVFLVDTATARVREVRETPPANK